MQQCYKKKYFMPKRAGRPSVAQKPAPKSDKIYGSKKNPKGSATEKKSKSINLSDKTINTLKYITEQYSVFEFLLGLGIYFGTKKEYHKYSLTDVFDIITQYAEKNYPEDTVLKKLIAIDYYLHFKVRPQSLYFKGLEKTEQNKFIERGDYK